jgi:hypothetical protein
MIFKCNACGNLHGARVESCGMCGSQDVALVQEIPPTQPPPPAGDAPSSQSPDAFFAETIAPLFERALAYVRQRDEDREDRLRALDAAEDERRETRSTAVVELCGALTDLARAGIDFLRQAATTKRDPENPTG